MPSHKHLVLLVHGIRDIGRWRAEIANTLEKAGFDVELTNYGRMNLLEFLLPMPFFDAEPWRLFGPRCNTP
jgi:hypothetical protein